jgi:hypothetical protein
MTTGASQSDDLVREAFLRRGREALEQVARSASVAELAGALGAATDFGAVARALGSGNLPVGVVALDPLADAVARGVAAREGLMAACGGLLSAAEVGGALRISRQAVDKRRRAGQVLALRVAGDWRYPAAQIGAAGEIPAGLPAVLAEAAALGMGPWSVLDFLVTPDETLGGRSPLDCLHAGGAVAALVARLLTAAQVDAFG